MIDLQLLFNLQSTRSEEKKRLGLVTDGYDKTQLAQSLLVSHLLSQASVTATIIDTRGSFDVRRLHRGLVSRMEASGGLDEGSSASSTERAGQILGRVKIMRVFDVDGMLEGIAEMKEDLERVLEERSEGGRGGEEAVPVPGIKSTIADSQGDEEEMLDDSAPVAAGSDAAPRAEQEDLDLEERCHMLVIDNLSQVISPMIKTDYVQGMVHIFDCDE